MQEEVTQKTIALSVKTARVTADVLKNMLRKYLSGQKQKGKNPYKVGKQSYKELKSQGSGLSNIEITDGNIKSFERVAKKYRLDFALKKDSSTKPPRRGCKVYYYLPHEKCQEISAGCGVWFCQMGNRKRYTTIC